jgi:hypothetical protein
MVFMCALPLGGRQEININNFKSVNIRGPEIRRGI